MKKSGHAGSPQSALRSPREGRSCARSPAGRDRAGTRSTRRNSSVALGRAPVAGALAASSVRLQRPRNLQGDFILDGEQVLELRIELLGPDCDAGLSVHEPRGHTHPVARRLHAALEQIAHVELPADDAQILAAVPKGKRRSARNDGQPRQAGRADAAPFPEFPRRGCRILPNRRGFRRRARRRCAPAIRPVRAEARPTASRRRAWPIRECPSRSASAAATAAMAMTASARLCLLLAWP